MRYNKLFKSDSQRLAFLSLRWVLCFRWYGLVMWQRCSHLNAALCDRAKFLGFSTFVVFDHSLFGVGKSALSTQLLESLKP